MLLCGNPVDWRKNTPFVLPAKDIFDAPAGDSPETATAIGHNIMALLGMDIAKIRFEPFAVLPDEVALE